MAVLEIIKVGDELLRQKSEPVKSVTKKLSKLINDMIDTMYSADGVGLAAPQIGVLERIIVIDAGDGPLALINPTIVEAEGELIDVEGCLSVPGTTGYVKRAAVITVVAMDEKGKQKKLEAEGFLARILQHEIDHLEGILFVDKVIEEEPEEKESD